MAGGSDLSAGGSGVVSVVQGDERMSSGLDDDLQNKNCRVPSSKADHCASQQKWME